MKTQKKTIVMLAAIFAILLASLSETYAQRSVTGNKNVTTVEHQVDNFTAIEAGAAFRVFLEKADAPLVVIETDENLHEQINLRVRSGKLSIASRGITNPTKLNVTVYYTGLVAAEISGAATLTTRQQLKTEEFFLSVSGASKADVDINTAQLISEISGASKVTLDGKSGTHITTVSGAANLNAVNLLTEITRAKVSGAANAKVTATEKIDSDVSGAGSLEYFDGTSMVKIGREGQFSIHIDENINLDSLALVDVKTSPGSDSVRIRIGNLEIDVFDGEHTRVRVGSGNLEVAEDGKVKFKKEKKRKFNGHWAGFNLGVNGYLTPDGSLTVPKEYNFLDLKYEKSINVHLNLFEQNFNLIDNRFGMVTGLGIEWNNYRFNDRVVLDSKADAIALKTPVEGEISRKSKLNVRYLNVPLIFEYQTNSKSNVNSFHIGAGVVGGLRIGSHSKNVFEGRRKVKDRDDFHLNPLKADATVRIGWGKINLYGNYSLVSLFRDERGPELYPFSVGLTLLSF